jgi:bifunctional non-homologous end joining protein LigD
MRKSPFEPCIPTRSTKVPTGKDWLHEIKHDGYRLIVQRGGKRVRLFTRNGYDWTARYPLIVKAALRNRSSSFVIDGEAVLLGVDGISDFNGLHSRRHDDEVQVYAFDVLALDGEDLRKLPLTMRKTNLARLLARRPDGIFIAPFETGEIGPDLKSLRIWAGTFGVRTPGQPLSTGALAKLDQGEEPEASGDGEGQGGVRMKVWVYINNSREAGDVYHLKVFANEETAERWFAENDPEGVAFVYPVIGAGEE